MCVKGCSCSPCLCRVWGTESKLGVAGKFAWCWGNQKLQSSTISINKGFHSSQLQQNHWKYNMKTIAGVPQETKHSQRCSPTRALCMARVAWAWVAWPRIAWARVAWMAWVACVAGWSGHIPSSHLHCVCGRLITKLMWTLRAEETRTVFPGKKTTNQ